jgi:hypothetical protein
MGDGLLYYANCVASSLAMKEIVGAGHVAAKESALEAEGLSAAYSESADFLRAPYAISSIMRLGGNNVSRKPQ